MESLETRLSLPQVPTTRGSGETSSEPLTATPRVLWSRPTLRLSDGTALLCFGLDNSQPLGPFPSWVGRREKYSRCLGHRGAVLHSRARGPVLLKCLLCLFEPQSIECPANAHNRPGDVFSEALRSPSQRAVPTLPSFLSRVP